MSETAFDFMKIWTQSDEKLEIRIETVLRDSLDSVVQLRDASTSRILDRNPMNSPPRVGINGGLFTSKLTGWLSGIPEQTPDLRFTTITSLSSSFSVAVLDRRPHGALRLRGQIRLGKFISLLK